MKTIKESLRESLEQVNEAKTQRFADAIRVGYDDDGDPNDYEIDKAIEAAYTMAAALAEATLDDVKKVVKNLSDTELEDIVTVLHCMGAWGEGVTSVDDDSHEVSSITMIADIFSKEMAQDMVRELERNKDEYKLKGFKNYKAAVEAVVANAKKLQQFLPYQLA